MSKKILIVDDEPHIARILSMSLQRAGYTVTTAANGLAALDALRTALPDLLISDIEMPKMNGRELLDTIAVEFPERVFPIYLMTSRTNLEYRAWAQEFQNLTFFEKPLSARNLVRALQETLATSAQL